MKTYLAIFPTYPPNLSRFYQFYANYINSDILNNNNKKKKLDSRKNFIIRIISWKAKI